MKVVGVLALGAGAYLMYYAIRNQTTHPLGHVKTALANAGKAPPGG